ncbi:MAG: SRPBCC family protein [Actinomycetota bacterium]
MNTFTITRTIDAPLEAVWAILDDFGNIADWSPGVRRSALTTDGPVGEGTTRHCDFAPMGGVNERITHHEPLSRMTVHLYETFKMPVTDAVADFKLEATETGTRVVLDVEYRPNRVGRLAKSVTDGQMRKGMGGLVDDLAQESIRRVAPVEASATNKKGATDAAA